MGGGGICFSFLLSLLFFFFLVDFGATGRGLGGVGELRSVTRLPITSTFSPSLICKKLGDWRRIDILWFLLHDQIHHRGQFSVYLRMAGGQVPSIYGPSGDEPWT